MNKFTIAILILLVGIGTFSACEKDDICVDDDTPQLIIRFYDAENPTVFKAVPGLRVIGVGNGNPVDTFIVRSSTLDSIAIPLKTNDISSQFSFILNSTDDENGAETGTTDQLKFSYATAEIFKSRACGFVVNYDNLTTDFTTATESWIQSIEIVKPLVTIEEEVTAHVKIFH
jgi:hypothetical protein